MDIKNIVNHMKIEWKLLLREPWVWVKMFIIMPINMFLPYYFMARAFNNEGAVYKITSTTLIWAYIYFTVFESFLSKEKIIHSKKLESLFMLPGAFFNWIIGQTLAINLFYATSFIFSGFLVFNLSNIKITYIGIFILFIIALFTSLTFNILIFSIQLIKRNFFHVFNISMDWIHILVGVLYPITLFPFMIKIISYLIPLTYALQFIRYYSLSDLIINIVLNFIYLLSSIIILRRSIGKYKNSGELY